MHKVGEIQRILDRLPVRWRTTNDWREATQPHEAGESYEDNAGIKARVWCERTGLWTIADDSGLEVEALSGRPGVRSARYGANGQDPIAKLLEEMRGIPPERRHARFVCAAVLVGPDGTFALEHGYLTGFIAEERRGSEGFGFDPVFIPEGFEGAHLAELPSEVKNRISHRARAFHALRPALESAIRGNM